MKKILRETAVTYRLIEEGDNKIAIIREDEEDMMGTYLFDRSSLDTINSMTDTEFRKHCEKQTYY
jgi:hypothetical protein